MPLSVFDKTLSHYQEVIGGADGYGHSFGGNASSFGIRFGNCEPLHLIYRLNQDDPAVNLGLVGIRWLPLVYHLSYAAFDGKLIYRVLSDHDIEVIAPKEANFDPEFPNPSFPLSFPGSTVSFQQQSYDRTKAEDALKLAAVFRLDQLSPLEMKRAIIIAEETSRTISECGFEGWEPEDIVREMHREPFFQGPPLKSCDNPNCTAEIAYRAEGMTVTVDDPNYIELTGETTLTLAPRDLRRDSMRVFAIFQPDNDDRVWPHTQLVYEICECCQCIRVTNQCD